MIVAVRLTSQWREKRYLPGSWKECGNLWVSPIDVRFPVLLVEGRIQSGQNGGRIDEFRESGALHQLGLLLPPSGEIDQVIVQRPVLVGQRQIEVAGFDSVGDVENVERRPETPVFSEHGLAFVWFQKLKRCVVTDCTVNGLEMVDGGQ